VWTPRRILLLIATTITVIGIYFGYSQLLGGIDGLPELPSDYLVDTGEVPPASAFRDLSPTRENLKRAFGPNSPEVVDNGLAYKLKTQLNDKGIVLACGQPAFNSTPAEPSKKVVVAPFSVAFFGKPKAPGEVMLPGEIEEISTFHADTARLEFDRPVANPQDMREAKLMGMELISTPDVANTDPRSGRIWVTNNQKSRDPSQFLIFSTTGPVYYRAPEEGQALNPDVPQLWTNATVEVIDKRNLPRTLRNNSTNTNPAKGDDLRNRGVIASILLGEMAPPPTITAEGLKIFLVSQDKATPGKDGKVDKRNNTGYTGVRLIELTRKVQFNLWSDGGAGFPGTNPSDAKTEVITPEPSLALAAVGGSVLDGGAIANKFANRTLLIVETQGSFRFDYTTNIARFETDGTITTDGPNHVAVTRLSPFNTQDNLFSTLLVIEFDGNKPTPTTPGQPVPVSAGPTGGMKIKVLTATGPHVYVSVAGEELLAQGTELKYTVDAKNRTTVTNLRGSPVVALKEKNSLSAGGPKTLGEIIITSIDPPAKSNEAKKTTLAVNGMGNIELFDAATGAKTVRASWGRSLTQEKVKIGKEEQDLLKFEGGAEFFDEKADMKLNAAKIWLWLGNRTDVVTVEKKAGMMGGQAVPQRLDAVGQVRLKSPDLVINRDDQLKLWFRDVPTPVVPEKPTAVVATAPMPKPGTTPMPMNPVATPPMNEVAKAPEPAAKPKPPIELGARVIESWLIRYPQGPIAKAEPGKPKPASPALRYEMERAICEDNVVIHQDPTDPAKTPRGLDIAGGKVTLTANRIGNEVGQIMTVTGTPSEIAQVHFETLSLFGPIIKIDQVSNTVAIDGIGSLLMPSNSDFAGSPTDKPNELEIRWVKSMFFQGAKGTAEFLGQVNATQRPAREGLLPKPAEVAPLPRVQTVSVQVPAKVEDETWNISRLLCHRLDTTFDRPIYFNQFRRDESKKKYEDGSPKLKTALCIPLPDDEGDPKLLPAMRKVTFTDETYSQANKLVKAQRIEAKELNVRMRDKMQEIFATGPGEVRMLQPDGGGEFGKPTPPKPATKPSEVAPFKLTLVKFTNRMEAVDKNKLFQKATFSDGANVWQIPTRNINLNFAAHEPPLGTTSLACSQSLEVSTSKSRPGADPEQTLVATGNAEFSNDDYDGLANRITSDGKAVTLFGTTDRLANIYKRKQSVAGRDGTRARTIVYLKDGTITATEGGSGAFAP
jgi:hypothetical protein